MANSKNVKIATVTLTKRLRPKFRCHEILIGHILGTFNNLRIKMLGVLRTSLMIVNDKSELDLLTLKNSEITEIFSSSPDIYAQSEILVTF